VREKRSLTLTPQARNYLPGVRAAFQDLRLATDRLRRRENDNVLTVSTLASFAAKWLLPRLNGFQDIAPTIDVRITTSIELIDFRDDDVDAAIRYGHGQWPGLRADWLMADEIFPVCSPALLKGARKLETPEDLAHHTLLHTAGGMSDDWQLWLTAAGLELPRSHGVSFDLTFVTLQAAIDGMGVAIGRTSYVEDDIAKGRLVVPFKIALPADAGFYLVTPKERSHSPKLDAFRSWLIEAARNKPMT
jgi:LysR family glycine cleavage system transcriptional activator